MSSDDESGFMFLVPPEASALVAHSPMREKAMKRDFEEVECTIVNESDAQQCTAANNHAKRRAIRNERYKRKFSDTARGLKTKLLKKKFQVFGTVIH